MSGGWKDGFLDGSVSVTMEDGSILQAVMRRGAINGVVKKLRYNAKILILFLF